MEEFYDQGPFGLNLVCEPPEVTVDIVAVHGLGAYSKMAWTRSVKERKINWLADKDLLPKDLPTARIFTFDYASRWHKNAPWQRRSLCANQLLTALDTRREREPDTKYRPLIFVGHSFGGIIIEEALVTANKPDGQFLYLTIATVGIVFLGTPHRGTQTAKWGELIAISGKFLGLGSEDRILKELKQDSDVLNDLLYEFTLWLFRYSVPTVCFFEQYETDYGRRYGISWKKLVVDEYSACLQGHRKVMLPTDHQKINKFLGPDDQLYQTVALVLREMAHQAEDQVKTRLSPRQIVRDDSIIAEPQKRILSALFLTNPLDDLAKIHRNKGDIVPGTCEWLLIQPKFVSWLVDDGMQVLRLVGGPGIGKTMLSSFLVRELEKKLVKTSNMILAYYFCDNKDDKRNADTAVLRGLLLQLLRQVPSLFRFIQPEYDEQKDAMFNSFDTLWRVFCKILGDLQGEVYILIDALDECHGSNLLEAMAKLSVVPQNVKFFLTSRPDEENDRAFKHGSLLRVDFAAVNTDLELFIREKVEELSRLKRYSPKIHRLVRESLTKKAGGTFLWVSLILKDLSATKLPKLVQEKLKFLPSDLYEAYDRILRQIGDEYTEYARLILTWVVCANRPLGRKELQMALALSLDSSESEKVPADEDLEGLEKADTLCGDLLYYDAQTDTVNLYHQSIKDYLLSGHVQMELPQYRVSLERANHHIFKMCWRYLGSKDFDHGQLFIERDGHTLYRVEPESYVFKYADDEWVNHALATEQALLEEPFSVDSAPTLRDWWLICASQAGQAEIVKKLLELGADVFAVDRSQKTALHMAAGAGHEGVVKVLLEKGVNVNAQDDARPINWSWSPLEWIFWEMESHDLTALHMAVRNNHEGVVRLLLENEANVNLPACDKRTALHMAAGNGYETMVRLLLEKGADVRAKDGRGQTAQQKAADRGHEAVMRLLQ